MEHSEARLIAWVRQELVLRGVATPTEADEALDRCREVLHLRDETSAATFLARFESACVNAVTAARATERCQGGSEWWHSSGASAWRHLADGRFVEAMAAQAEFLAGPTDVEVDFNWPDEKLFPMAEIPNGCCEGDRVILGDGEGGRTPPWSSKTANAGSCQSLGPTGIRRSIFGLPLSTRRKLYGAPRSDADASRVPSRCRSVATDTAAFDALISVNDTAQFGRRVCSGSLDTSAHSVQFSVADRRSFHRSTAVGMPSRCTRPRSDEHPATIVACRSCHAGSTPAALNSSASPSR